MSEKSSIEWTNATWNPWHGCRKVSPGCAHCYMFTEKKMYGQDPTLVVRSKTKFSDPLKWKEPKLIFTCSWSDWFIDQADAWRPEAWEIIRRTPHHTYQILTKRPERIAGHLPEGWPFPNVWLGVSVEDQKRAEERVPQLLWIPAAVWFLSVEPLLGPVDLTQLKVEPPKPEPWHAIPVRGYISEIDALRGEAVMGRFGIGMRHKLDWIICGGESGPKARPMKEEWALSLRDQCVAAGVPFFFKQWGGVQKKKAGRVLDGRTWDEFPNQEARP